MILQYGPCVLHAGWIRPQTRAYWFSTEQWLCEGVLMLRLYIHCFVVGTGLMCIYFVGGGLGGNSPQWTMASSFTRFLDHTQRRTTIGMTPLDERSARRRDLYLTKHSTHKRQTSIWLLWTRDQPVAETSNWQHTTLTRQKSMGLLWTSHQPVAETSTWQHTDSQQTDIHAPGGLRTHNLNRRAVAYPRLKPRSRWDQLTVHFH